MSQLKNHSSLITEWLGVLPKILATGADQIDIRWPLPGSGCELRCQLQLSTVEEDRVSIFIYESDGNENLVEKAVITDPIHDLHATYHIGSLVVVENGAGVDIVARSLETAVSMLTSYLQGDQHH
jgi:hypothetical protein